ncbi:MAG: CocE/NonD family hydrolase [Treponemataceae bacterium]
MRVEEYLVPLSDGLRLRTIVCRPEGNAPLPVLFMRTPYPQLEENAKKAAQSAVERGYAYVFQFCRGTGGSEGDWVPNANERKDGIDGLQWLSSQPWCDWIGIHGISYMALTGWIVADALPDKVRGLFLCHYGIDRHLSAYRDGLFRHDILTGWTMQNAGKSVTDNFARDYLRSCVFRPHLEADEKLWGVRLDWYRDWITNVDYTAPYWHSGFWKQLREIPGKVGVPVCVVAGWFDHHLEGTLLAFEELSEKIKKRSELIVGSWTHDFVPSVAVHPSARAALDINAVILDWFDSLSGRGKRRTPGVTVYVAGEDTWKRSDRWPVPTAGRKIRYLSPQGDSYSGAYRLSDSPAVGPESVIEYRYDPDDPVRSVGGETLLVSESERGCRKQPGPGARADVITFISDPFIDALPICGEIGVSLSVSSDAEDTCFAVKISEVFPNGEAYNIRSGITTLAYRNGRTERGTYTPDEIVDIKVKTLPITWTMGKGSRLRLDVASSDFPQYCVHTNYPGVWSTRRDVKIARQRLHIGGSRGAFIEIPIQGVFSGL